jgi:putative phosphoesterase
MKIGVVSDTHSLFRPELVAALAGVSQILHLGDVGKASILKDLNKIAPVTAVRGNIDVHGSCERLPETDVVLIEGHYLYLLHNLQTLHLNPEAAKFSAVLYGHTHQPSIDKRRGVLYFNPGSCGPRRFLLPVTCGILTVEEGKELKSEIVELVAV